MDEAAVRATLARAMMELAMLARDLAATALPPDDRHRMQDVLRTLGQSVLRSTGHQGGRPPRAPPRAAGPT